jgi:hypothetical protein
MNRSLTVLFAAAEALLVAAIGLAIALVPLTVLWGAQFGFAPDWAIFWRASVDVWLLGHGVNITFVLDPAVAAALALPGSETPVTVTIALLGFALLTGLLAMRSGRRIAETRHRVLGELTAVGAFAAISLGLTLSTVHPAAQPSLWQGVALPTGAFALGMLIGVRRTRDLLDDRAGLIRDRIAAWPSSVAIVAATAARGGAAAAAGALALASIVTSLALIAGFARIITLYESLHTELLGGVAVTLGELALMPNAVIWSMSWLVGPGFAIGTGSAVSPLGTTLGPLPSIPLLGALPESGFDYGFVGLVVPVATGFLVAALFGPRLRRSLEGDSSVLTFVTGLGMGLIGGALLGTLAWWSGGAAGPGRLADVGPNPVAVGALAALELGIGALAGLAASSRTVRRSGADRRGGRSG